MNAILTCLGGLSALLLTALPARSQAVLPLDSVLRAVARRNPALRPYEARTRAREAAVAGASAWEPPRLSAGYWMTPYNQRASREMNNGQAMGMRMVSVEQMLPNPAKQQARRAYLAGQAAVEQAGQAASLNQLRAQARTFYYGRLMLEKKLRVLRENETLLAFLLKIAQARYPYNQTSLPSIYQVQARAGMLANERAQLAGELRQYTIGLNTLMARDPAAGFAIDSVLPAAAAGSAPDTAALAARRADVRGLDQSRAVVQLSQALEASRRRPDFGVRFDHMAGIGSTPNQFSVMGMVTLPFVPWAARDYRAGVAALGFEARAVQQQRTALLTEAAGRVSILLSEERTRREQLATYEKAILPALRKAYQVTLLAYEQNTAQLPAVVETLDAWLQARLQYLDVQLALLTLRIRYDQELEQ